LVSIRFGSGARGEMGPNSDADLLVVKGGRYDRGRLAEKTYVNLRGVAQAVDVIVVTPEQMEKYHERHWMVIWPALREGLEVYHSRAGSIEGRTRMAPAGSSDRRKNNSRAHGAEQWSPIVRLAQARVYLCDVGAVRLPGCASIPSASQRAS
jgi:hypothetical protein